MIAKTDDPQFVRDLASNALLNTDKNALTRNRAQRSSVQRAMSMEREVGTLRGQVSQLTRLVEQLLNQTR